MLTIIILTGIAIIALFIGFLEIQIPFISKNTAGNKQGKGIVKEPSKRIEAFYRSIRTESWIKTIQERSASNAGSLDTLSQAS